MKRIAQGFGLLESARWSVGGTVLFSDMTNGGVRSIDEWGDVRMVIPYRKGIGGIVPHADGGLVVTGRNVAIKHRGHEADATTVLLELSDNEVFFNDAAADTAGRVYVGSVARDPLHEDPAASRYGRLYCIGVDGSVSVLADDVGLSNGIGVSPTGDQLLHVDSDARTVWSYPLGAAGASPRREQFVDTSEYSGVPDGLAVAQDGSVWVALFGGGLVVGWDAAGRRLGEVAVPQPLVTSLCFGGDDRMSLFVVTGSRDDDDPVGSGCIYVAEAPVAGMLPSEATVRVGPPANHEKEG